MYVLGMLLVCLGVLQEYPKTWAISSIHFLNRYLLTFTTFQGSVLSPGDATVKEVPAFQ